MIMEMVPVGSQMARACTGRQAWPGGGDGSSRRGSGAAERPEAADEGGGSSWLGQPTGRPRGCIRGYREWTER